ncbi:MAG: hypothetical protein NTX15_07695 [Candidatus Kapabacteria bacterium]|nr:hypothetical protein [Candidatus Kapabacteria bacterium]
MKMYISHIHTVSPLAQKMLCGKLVFGGYVLGSYFCGDVNTSGNGVVVRRAVIIQRSGRAV